MTGRPFRFSDRVRSFGYALRGVGVMLRSQHNAWIHALGTLLVCAAGLWLGIGAYEWCWIVLAIMAVWTAEALNTAFEFLCDVASPEFHPLVAKAKDVAAGAVLISSIGSLTIGLLVLGPALLAKFKY
jgi:diacylglycerol kinase (ATP)